MGGGGGGNGRGIWDVSGAGDINVIMGSIIYIYDGLWVDNVLIYGVKLTVNINIIINYFRIVTAYEP